MYLVASHQRGPGEKLTICSHDLGAMLIIMSVPNTSIGLLLFLFIRELKLPRSARRTDNFAIHILTPKKPRPCLVHLLCPAWREPTLPAAAICRGWLCAQVVEASAGPSAACCALAYGDIFATPLRVQLSAAIFAPPAPHRLRFFPSHTRPKSIATTLSTAAIASATAASTPSVVPQDRDREQRS
jgi:hypothetical protein